MYLPTVLFTAATTCALTVSVAQAVGGNGPREGGFEGAGWLSAALLGAVLSLLLFRYLPSRDKQMHQLLDDQRKHVHALTGGLVQAVQEVSSTFRSEVERVRREGEARLERLLEEERQNRVALQANTESMQRLNTMLAQAISMFDTTWDFLGRRGVVEAKQRGYIEET